MSSQAKLHSILRSSLFIAAVTAGSSVWFGSTGQAQPAAAVADIYKKLDVQYKTDKEVNDKRKEKDKAKSTKSDKIDIAPIDDFYTKYLVPRLTNPSPEVINATRVEFITDITSVEASPASAIREYNQKLIGLLRDIILPRDKVVYAPASRINAAIILCRLNASASAKDTKTTPDAMIQPLLAALIEPKEIDALSSLALTTLARHCSEKVVSDNAEKQFVAKIRTFLDAPVPPARSAEANKYLIGQCIDCLNRMAESDPEKEASKEASAYLAPLLVKLIDTEESEWLLETVCMCIGSITPANLSEEDIGKLEVGIAKYARKSLREWKKRISMSSGALGGSAMGGYAGGGEGGYPGMGGGMDKGSSGMGSYSDGMGGMGGPGQRKGTNPYEHQPKEVKNARRIAHQRFERIHFALNGLYRKPEPKAGEPVVLFPATDRGIAKLMPEGPKKENIKKLIEKIEAFQTELNDEKIADLGSLTTLTGKSMKGLREICVEIMG
ncbi:MAG: hypothetical protein ABL921_18290, partial [Pirellula sp.]